MFQIFVAVPYFRFLFFNVIIIIIIYSGIEVCSITCKAIVQ